MQDFDNPHKVIILTVIFMELRKYNINIYSTRLYNN